ncbi:O-methyltransferase family 3 [Cellulomonas fimi ATCC 484]|uniref:O-methyltransferase family 3 n=1 Tax=Cellulomonas fimi (strain ATCC 484 / DSM 20113 / JCM 1341 / CCUG 24087 / LMG 16345 / NBRC 15513 / NCIMB 8980 / NCTC 7547 / NRS-133) TaxID=590998 RepID=F4H6U7_CELFA|nr:O-methyltransferase family 3 [Cellulomonas fimi ATCC 484]
MQGSSAVTPQIAEYLDGLVHEPPHLAAVGAWIEENEEPIHISPAQGAALRALVAATGARRVLEIGTHVGYSALWIAEALAPAGGRLVSLEVDPRRAQTARTHLAASPWGAAVTVVTCDARDWLATSDDEFDLVFLDAEKILYLDLFRAAWDRLRTGGSLVADNTLHKGRVVAPVKDSTRAIAALNVLATSGSVGHGTVLPLGDGLTLVVKTADTLP